MGEIAKVLAGAKNPLGWLVSGRGAVPKDQSAARAATCIACPKNGYGPLTNWFTEPAAELIRLAIETRVDYKLDTPFDAALGTCEACFCPLKLKVHEPIDLVIAGLSTKAHDDLWEKCWIRHEEKTPVTPKQPNDDTNDGNFPLGRL